MAPSLNLSLQRNTAPLTTTRYNCRERGLFAWVACRLGVWIPASSRGVAEGLQDAEKVLLQCKSRGIVEAEVPGCFGTGSRLQSADPASNSHLGMLVGKRATITTHVSLERNVRASLLAKQVG